MTLGCIPRLMFQPGFKGVCMYISFLLFSTVELVAFATAINLRLKSFWCDKSNLSRSVILWFRFFFGSFDCLTLEQTFVSALIEVSNWHRKFCSTVLACMRFTICDTCHQVWKSLFWNYESSIRWNYSIFWFLSVVDWFQLICQLIQSEVVALNSQNFILMSHWFCGVSNIQFH